MPFLAVRMQDPEATIATAVVREGIIGHMMLKLTHECANSANLGSVTSIRSIQILWLYICVEPEIL